MPNGTSSVFVCRSDELARVLQPIPENNTVAFALRDTPAEFTALSVDGLRQLLREHPQERVVAAEENDYYVIRLVPPLVYVREVSKLFRILKHRHPGGVHIYDKHAIEAMVDGLRSTDIAGDLMTKDRSTVAEDVTAGMLLSWVWGSEGLRVWEQERSWYMLELGASADRGVPRWVGVTEGSILVPELRRLQLQYSTGQ